MQGGSAPLKSFLGGASAEQYPNQTRVRAKRQPSATTDGGIKYLGAAVRNYI